ncbi:MAG: tripartite tricarboxylate transporter substrate binding protein [Burkholderiales bacterium]|nr:tripartite tricarboxylate transporter substrate binding protein [Burkholderiales bacterium]
MKRNLSLWLGAAAIALLPLTAAAQAWPSKPIRLIVPFPPGGPTDLVGREAANILRSALGQAVVVENRPGGNGTVGLEVLAKAAPDGYTIGLTAITLSIAPHLGNAPFDPFKDFTPISNLVAMTPVVVANLSLPVANLRELAAHAQANPGRLAFGTPGVATVPHLGAELLQKAGNFQLLHVPFKGAAQQIQDLIGGSTLLDFQSSLVVALPQIRAGKIKALAVLTARRAPQLPEVPTAAESGFPNVVVAPWFGIGGPAGLPADMVARMHEALVRGMQGKEAVERFSAIGAVIGTSASPTEFSAYIRSEYTRWGDVIRSANIKAE